MKDTETIKDQWTTDGSIFIHYGCKYGVAPDGSNICLGPAQEAPDKPLDGKKGVTKLSTKGNGQGKNIQVQEMEVLLHKNKGGRPRKLEGEKVTRQTKWRHQKEL